MDIAPILEFVGYAIYTSMAAAALAGVYFVVMLILRIGKIRFSGKAAAGRFLEDTREELNRRNFDGVMEICESSPYRDKATAKLVHVAMENRDRPLRKLQRLLAERFEREILADLEYRTSWVATIVKSAPMLGLLGTVVGMINAFGKIAAATDTGTDPKALANDISFALFTTALGLTIAIPLVLAGAAVHVRIGKLQDSVQDQLGEFLDDFDVVQNSAAG